MSEFVIIIDASRNKTIEVALQNCTTLSNNGDDLENRKIVARVVEREVFIRIMFLILMLNATKRTLTPEQWRNIQLTSSFENALYGLRTWAGNVKIDLINFVPFVRETFLATQHLWIAIDEANVWVANKTGYFVSKTNQLTSRPLLNAVVGALVSNTIRILIAGTYLSIISLDVVLSSLFKLPWQLPITLSCFTRFR